jgi:hypothetical protein
MNINFRTILTYNFSRWWKCNKTTTFFSKFFRALPLPLIPQCFWDTAYPHFHSAAGSDILVFWTTSNSQFCRSQWLRGLMLRPPAVARLLGLRFRTSPEEWISVSCDCCVLSVRGLGNEVITRPAVSYRLWCVVVCDLETSWIRRS